MKTYDVTVVNPSEDDAQEIEWALEAAADEMANEYAAEGRSNIGDQDLIDLDEMGYDDQSAIQIAEFGYAFVVNSDVLVSPFFEKELRVKKKKHPQTWTEAKVGDRNAATALYPWMDKHDYVRVDRLSGAWPTGEEAEIQTDFIIDRVVADTEYTQEDVQAVADSSRDFSGELTYWSSSSGDINMYAQPNYERIAEIGAETGAYMGEGSSPSDVENDIDNAFEADSREDKYPAIAANDKAEKVYEDAFRRAYKKAAT